MIDNMNHDHVSPPDPRSVEERTVRELENIGKQLQLVEQHLSDLVGILGRNLDQGQPRR